MATRQVAGELAVIGPPGHQGPDCALEIVSAQHGAGKLDWLDDPVSPERRPMAGEDVTSRNILSVGTGRPSLLSVQPVENIDDELEPFPANSPSPVGRR